jgi:hypothetical protein
MATTADNYKTLSQTEQEKKNNNNYKKLKMKKK